MGLRSFEGREDEGSCGRGDCREGLSMETV